MLIGDDSQRFVSDLLLFRVHRTMKMTAIIGIIIYAAAIFCRISYGLPNYNKVKEKISQTQNIQFDFVFVRAILHSYPFSINSKTKIY